MKIFNSEGKAEKAYIQVKDVLLLQGSEFVLPEFIKNLTITEGLGETDFIEFTDPEEVSFIRCLDWILDYKLLRFFSKQDLLVKKQEAEEERNELEQLLSPSRDELLNKKVSQKFNVVDNKIKDYDSLIEFKRGKDSIPFPTVPDSEGFRMGESTGNYFIESGINPRKLLMSRRDGNAFDPEEKLSGSFLDFLMSAVVISGIAHNEHFLEGVEGDIKLGFDNSGKYVIAEVTTKPLEHSLEENKSREEAKGLKKLFGTFFRKFQNRNEEE